MMAKFMEQNILRILENGYLNYYTMPKIQLQILELQFLKKIIKVFSLFWETHKAKCMF
jgi:hypothetical protein